MDNCSVTVVWQYQWNLHINYLTTALIFTFNPSYEFLLVPVKQEFTHNIIDNLALI